MRKAISPVLLFHRTTMPKWACLQVKDDSYAYGYTKERCDDSLYYTFAYRISKDRKVWKLIAKFPFKDARDAKAKALELYEDRKAVFAVRATVAQAIKIRLGDRSHPNSVEVGGKP